MKVCLGNEEIKWQRGLTRKMKFLRMMVMVSILIIVMISCMYAYVKLYYIAHLKYMCCQVTSVVSDSVRLHRQQPTRLPRPWDSPGKNAGVGCHFLLQCMKGKSESEVTQLRPTLCNPTDCSPPGSSTHGIFQARVLEWGAIAFS